MSTNKVSPGEELKARIDKALSHEKYVQRRVDTIAELLDVDPSAIISICKEYPEEYNSSATKKSGLLISLVSRMNKILDEEQSKMKELLDGGTEDPETPLDPARKDIDAKVTKVKIPWKEVSNNIGHCHVVLHRTLRKLGNCKEKVKIEGMVRDMESLYTDLCEHISSPIE